MDAFISFLQSTSGRMLRVVLGLGVIAIGILFLKGTTGFLVAVIGLISILAALTGECAIGPLFGYTFEGTRRRSLITRYFQIMIAVEEKGRFGSLRAYKHEDVRI